MTELIWEGKYDKNGKKIAPPRVDEWLYARQPLGSLMEPLRPAPADLLVGTPVSTRVNSVQNDDPDCVRVAEDAASVTRMR